MSELQELAFRQLEVLSILEVLLILKLVGIEEWLPSLLIISILTLEIVDLLNDLARYTLHFIKLSIRLLHGDKARPIQVFVRLFESLGLFLR